MLKEIGATQKIMFKQCGKYYNTRDLKTLLCTGKQYSIKQFINFVTKDLKMEIKWRGKGINEKAFDKDGNCIIECKKIFKTRRG